MGFLLTPDNYTYIFFEYIICDFSLFKLLRIFASGKPKTITMKIEEAENSVNLKYKCSAITMDTGKYLK